MAEINIPTGPIHTAPNDAIRAEHGRQLAANRDTLATALGGLELGDHDLTVLDWLADWEPATVATICSWLHRARNLTEETR